jgi:cellulose synthase (UDP-forming)
MNAGPPRAGEQWSPTARWRQTRRRLALLVPADVALSVWYFSWLLTPNRVGNPVLYGLLVVAELFNLCQALGFWWTGLRARSPRRPVAAATPSWRVDVLIPVYNEEVEVVEGTVAAAVALKGAAVSVVVCDDGDREEIAALAARHGARYFRRTAHEGAKAGNLNHALAHTDAPVVAVLDCDHIPDPRFLTATLGHLADPKVGLVQTPQYYANAGRNPIAAAAWSQQALFFGIIARGKDAGSSMICCGTNLLFRRAALDAVGGIPEGSVTEDFELSIRLRSGGWRCVYVPEVLARGLGPEDMASYVGQQQRWARGCLSAIGSTLRAPMPWRRRLPFLLSSMFFLTGWTYLIYMTLPVVRILGGEQALAGATAAQFLSHFAPYFCASMLTVAVAGSGSYTFAAFALMEASFWIHIDATLRTLLRRRGRFVVTPKVGSSAPQPRAVAPALVALLTLAGAAAYGLVSNRSPATLNNVAFAGLHISVLLVGTWPALVGVRTAALARGSRELRRAVA